MSADAPRVSRRAVLATLAGAAVMSAGVRARARDRQPVGGRAALRVPWPLGALDPHRLDDIASAIFGAALFDSLYATDGGRLVPALAETMPEASTGGARVKLRAGVATAEGRPILARDVIASLARARAGDAKAWLADVPQPRRVDDTTLHFPGVEPSKLASALSSPLCAIVPARFSPERPDATGPFAASRASGALVLARNARAAQGPAFLDEVSVRAAVDLADSLRAFEAGSDDVGWLGSGLHEPRAGSRPFDAGAVGYSLLRTGRDAGSWDMPGVAQRLANGIAPSQLAHLAPGSPWIVEPDQGWGGSPCDLIVRDDSPYLIELARAVAAALARGGQAVTPRPIPTAQLRQRRASKSYALAIDVVRPFAPGLLGLLAALATSDNPELASDAVRHPPRVTDLSPRVIARTLRIGVLGEIRVQGGRAPDLSLPRAPGGGVSWADATRGRRTP